MNRGSIRDSSVTHESILILKYQLELIDNRLIGLVSILIKKLRENRHDSDSITMTLDYVSRMGSKFNDQQSERNERRQGVLSRLDRPDDRYRFRLKSYFNECRLRMKETRRQIKLVHLCLISIS